MKKTLTVVAAGAIFLSAVSAVFASTTLENKETTVLVTATSESNTGNNDQHGRGFLRMTTGDATSITDVLSVANQNATGSSHSHGNTLLKNKNTNVVVTADATSDSGNNDQGGHHSNHHSSQHLTTGNSGSASSVASWANINLQGVTISTP